MKLIFIFVLVVLEAAAESPIRIQKKGKCPPISGGIGPCKARCGADNHCPGDLKCCSNGCGRDCQKPVQDIKLVCPTLPKGTVGTCDERCSGDASCPGIQKCCSHGCGHSCQNPVKPGKCPAFKSDLVTICLVECIGDAACPGNQKCCSFGCHVRCSPPEAETPKHPCKRGVPEKDSSGNNICCKGCFIPNSCSRGYDCVDLTPGSRQGVCCLTNEKPERICKIGQPLKDNGQEIFCGRGPNRQNCPEGSSCVIDPLDRYAVCCRDRPTKPCKFGRPLGRCGKNRICPRGYSCERDGGVCCRRKPIRQCRRPLKRYGKAVLCTRRRRCPRGYKCRRGVCCPKPERKCDNGQPYKDNGIERFCGRGTGSQTCPEGYTCVIDPLDRFAVCCQKSESKCKIGQPYEDKGIEVFCGRGPGSQTCPEGYTCVIDSLDRFAVCCL